MDSPKNEIIKKNKVIPIILTNPITLSNSNNSTTINIEAQNTTTAHSNKENTISNPTSSMNSARTEQPLLMASPHMLKLPPMPPTIHSNKGSLSSGISNKKKKKFNANKKNMFISGSRVDSNGFPIMKGGKNHKIAFKDDLVRVIHIESYKKYNLESTNEATKNCLKCFCRTF